VVLTQLIIVGTHDIEDETNDIDGTVLLLLLLLFPLILLLPLNLASLFSVKRISGENIFSNLNGFAVTKK
jgi:hypothetical protein